MYKVKESIKEFKSYKPNTLSYDIKLDANESRVNESLLLDQMTLSTLNRYPDHYTVELKESIASLYKVDTDEVLVGSGSSELLELVTKTFVNPGDVVLSIKPSFVMYEKYTKISGGIFKTVDTDKDYQLNIDEFIKEVQILKPRLVFLCTPNNPTGAIISKKEVVRILNNIDSLIVIDEAYMEFSENDESVIEYINKYPNLIVNRTFSKAFALAGARLGYFIANKDLINTLSIIKTPYAVTTLSQQLGVLALKNLQYLRDNVNEVKRNKKLLLSGLQELGIKTYPSSTNFVFCEYTQKDLKQELEQKGILIRGFNNGTHRITIGRKEELDFLLKILEEIV